MIEETQPDIIVIEDFKVYPGKHRGLAWDDMPAPQIIGVLQTLCAEVDVPYVMQPPHYKRFFTNEVMKALDLYVMGKPHATDAFRHAAYYSMFVLDNKNHPDVQDKLRLLLEGEDDS